MTDIKINVKADADLGGISAAMDKLNQKAEELQATLGKSTKIGVDNTDALTKIKEVGRADEEAKSRVSGTPSSSTSETPEEIKRKREAQGIRELTDIYRKATGAKREFSAVQARAIESEIRAAASRPGAHGAFSKEADGSIERLYELSPETARRNLAHSGFIADSKKPKSGSGGFGGKLASAAAGMAGGMLSGGSGGDGMATAGSAVGGLVGGIFGMPGAMIGGALGGLVGGVVGGGLGDAKDESIGISDLRHSLGATTTDFNLLRESTRAAASGMGITYQESVKLAKQFSHNANTQGNDAGSVAAEVRLASAFSRSLGIDPSQGVEMMGTLRATRATGNEFDSRKMAMTIAESITKGGMTSKSDEVMSAIANFAQTAARASLQAPNVGGYADFLANLVSMKTPGLGVEGSSALMSKADAGIRSHGDMATDTFKLGAYMTAYGNDFSAADQQLYTSGGAMGTGRKTAESILADPSSSQSRKRSAQAVLRSGNADRVNQDIMMQQLGRFARGTSEYELSGAHLFGMEQSEFRKFDKAYYNNGSKSGMKGTLSGMGINVDKLDPEKYMHMGALLGSNRDELKAEAEKLIGGKGYDKSLSDKEKEMLSGTVKNGSEAELRQAVIKLNEDRSQIDDGAAVRQNTADMKNEITKLASALLPKVDALRDVMLMAFGKENEWAKHEKDVALAPRYAEIDKEVRAKFGDKNGKVGWNHQAVSLRNRLIEEANAKYDKEQNVKPALPAELDIQSGPENQLLKRGFDLLRRGNPADFKEGLKLIAQGKKEEEERRSAQQAQVVSSSSPLVKTQDQMLRELAPSFSGKVSEFTKALASGGIHAQILNGKRSEAENAEFQAEWEKQQRTGIPGPHGLAHEPGKHSSHLDGEGADFRFTDDNGGKIDPRDKRVSAAANSAGLRSGATFGDPNHFDVRHVVVFHDRHGKELAPKLVINIASAQPSGSPRQ